MSQHACTAYGDTFSTRVTVIGCRRNRELRHVTLGGGMRYGR